VAHFQEKKKEAPQNVGEVVFRPPKRKKMGENGLPVWEKERKKDEYADHLPRKKEKRALHASKRADRRQGRARDFRFKQKRGVKALKTGTAPKRPTTGLAKGEGGRVAGERSGGP